MAPILSFTFGFSLLLFLLFRIIIISLVLPLYCAVLLFVSAMNLCIPSIYLVIFICEFQ